MYRTWTFATAILETYHGVLPEHLRSTMVPTATEVSGADSTRHRTKMLELDTREPPALCSGHDDSADANVGIVRGGSAAAQARTRYREAYGESDRGDGSGRGNGGDD